MWSGSYQRHEGVQLHPIFREPPTLPRSRRFTRLCRPCPISSPPCVLAPLTTHGFRSSFRDWCEERANVPRTVSEAALAHVVKGKTEAAYRRTDLLEKRRNLMDRWARFVTNTPADVTALSA